MIDAGIKSMISFGNDELIPHFVYCGQYYVCPEHLRNNPNGDLFGEMLLAKMKKFGIQTSILTMFEMGRRNLITKEKAKDASKGKFKLNNESMPWVGEAISINDDLEMYLTNFLNSEEIKQEYVRSFFTPKLTEDELKLVELKNDDYLKSFWHHFDGRNPDVDSEEMQKSDSKAKYVYGQCIRRTILLTLNGKGTENQKVKRNRKMAVKSCCNIA